MGEGRRDPESEEVYQCNSGVLFSPPGVAAVLAVRLQPEESPVSLCPVSVCKLSMCDKLSTFDKLLMCDKLSIFDKLSMCDKLSIFNKLLM